MTVDSLSNAEKKAIIWLEAQAVEREGIINLEWAKSICPPEIVKSLKDRDICEVSVIPGLGGKTMHIGGLNLAYPAHGYVNFTETGLRLAGEVRFERATAQTNFKEEVLALISGNKP